MKNYNGKYMNGIKLGFLLVICLLLSAVCAACGSSAVSTNAEPQDLVTGSPIADSSDDGINGTSLGDSEDGYSVNIAEGFADGDIIDIKEKMFIAQTNDIYLNADDYLGKTLRYQGYFDTIEDEESGEVYCFVVRNGPGCCPGVDNTAGFEVAWDKPWPKPNDWVEAMGTLEEYEIEPGGMKYLRVKLEDLTVLTNRGAETVLQ